MRKVCLAMIAVVCLFATGCASKLMQPVAVSPAAGSLSNEQAAIVFYRPSFLGGGVQAPVVEAVNNDIQFVGIVSSGMKLLYKTTPGKHFFVVGGEGSNLLEADFEGGKTYYAQIDPKMGMFKPRFVFIPVTNADLKAEHFTKDMAACKWYANLPEGQTWFQNNYNSLMDKKNNAFEKKDKEGTPQRAIIIKQYGTTTPVQ